MFFGRSGVPTTKGDIVPSPWLAFSLDFPWQEEAYRVMPTYEYRCPEGHHFELFQKMSDEPRAHCPECGAEGERLLSGGAGFLFKGEGFYATDYRSNSYKKEASREELPESTQEAASKDSKETKKASPEEASSTPKNSKGSSKGPASETP
jgi:putative FmdB family regulatory protein